MHRGPKVGAPGTCKLESSEYRLTLVGKVTVVCSRERAVVDERVGMTSPIW
jgi:hypothetical protein